MQAFLVAYEAEQIDTKALQIPFTEEELKRILRHLLADTAIESL